MQNLKTFLNLIIFLPLINVFLLGRFGSYIPSPIKYIYIGEFLLIIFLLLNFKQLTNVDIKKFIYISLCIIYIAGKLFFIDFEEFSINIFLRNIITVVIKFSFYSIKYR